jgi:hypothetical protein
MKINFDKILIHVVSEIYLQSKSMPPLETFVTYRIHLRLSSSYIEDWDLSEKSIYISIILLSVFTFLHAYTQNPPNICFYIISPVKLAN